MAKKHPHKDRNFDDLSRRFTRNIYDSPKGQLRLAVLKRDFKGVSQGARMSVLDVGAGQGQFGLWLASLGHQVALTDISEEMLAQAKLAALEMPLVVMPTFECVDLWHLSEQHQTQSYDLVVCHAVLEWLEEPMLAIKKLTQLVTPRGWISLMFYNVHGLVFKNLLRANYKRVISGDIKGQRGSLTPINPLDPNCVLAALAQNGFEVIAHSGVRVFHDYILNAEDRARSFDSVLQLELQYSTVEPYRSLGRYVHVLARKID